LIPPATWPALFHTGNALGLLAFRGRGSPSKGATYIRAAPHGVTAAGASSHRVDANFRGRPCTALAPHGFGAPAVAFGLSPWPSRSSRGHAVSSERTDDTILSCPSSRVQSMTRRRSLERPSPDGDGLERPFHGVPCPSALAAMGSDLHRACLTRLCCAFRLSQPLDALIPPATWPALFHTGNALGLLAFRGFPSPVADATSRSRLPLVPFAIGSSPTRGSRGLRIRRVRSARPVLPGPRRPILSWRSPLRGVHLLGLGSSWGASSRGLRHVASRRTARRRTCSAECQRTEELAGLFRGCRPPWGSRPRRTVAEAVIRFGLPGCARSQSTAQGAPSKGATCIRAAPRGVTAAGASSHRVDSDFRGRPQPH
jgi:hypothetical protein